MTCRSSASAPAAAFATAGTTSPTSTRRRATSASPRRQLKTSLSDGSTLADIAKEKGKSVDGLKAALVAAAKADLAQAVKDGRLTEAQQTEILADLSDRIDGLVNGELGLHHAGPRPARLRLRRPAPAGDA